jgi:predicted N-acetyltransferase YhbS
MTSQTRAENVTIRQMREQDADIADRTFRVAFGTFLGMPEPERFAGEAEMVRARAAADPSAALVAEAGGDFAGSNFVVDWGSVGFFGPLTVRPDLWNQGVAQKLLDATIGVFERLGTRHMGLFTFPHSTKHVYLYQRFGFWPRFLTAIMSRQVVQGGEENFADRYSRLPASERDRVLNECAELTGSIYEGLDLRREIEAIANRELGETLLVQQGGRIEGIACCHFGRASEADAGECYVKFAAVRPGGGVASGFDRLLDAVQAFSAAEDLQRVTAGVNTARRMAYRQMMARGFRTMLQGVTMHRPDEPGYDREDVFLLDDWR